MQHYSLEVRRPIKMRGILIRLVLLSWWSDKQTVTINMPFIKFFWTGSYVYSHYLLLSDQV